MSGPRIEIVIPAYRAARTIRRTIDSLLAQQGVSVGIIVVIDGDFDDTAARIADYPAERVRVVANRVNQGAARARNQGLGLVRAPFMMFVDADDYVEGPMLSGLLEAIGREAADIAFAPMEILHERSGLRSGRHMPDVSSPEALFREWHVEGRFVTPCSVMWRTEFVRAIGGWDDTLTRNDDGELVMRAVLKGARLAASHKGCGLYVKHSATSLNNRTDNMESMLRANEKLRSVAAPAIDPALRDALCAGHDFNIAWHCYLAGQDTLGDTALARSRAAGFGTRGPWLYRVAFRLFGLKASAKLLRRLKALRT